MLTIRLRKPKYLATVHLILLLLLAPASMVMAQDGGGDGPPPGIDVSGNDTDANVGGSCPGGCPPGGGDGSSVTPPGQGGNDGNGDSDSGNSGSGNGNPGSSSGNGDGDLTIDGQPWCSPSGDGTGGNSNVGGIDHQTDVTGTASVTTCQWSCGGSDIWFGSVNGGDWEVIAGSGDEFDYGGITDGNGNGTAVDDYMQAYNSGAASTPTCGDWDTSNVSFSGKSRVEYICWSQLSFGGGGGSGSSGSTGVSHGGHNFTCGGNYGVTASSSVPCPSVVRDPYPRALVNTPNQFILSSGGTAASSNTREWCEPDIRNYTISVGWDQLPITPIWDWNERAWSDQPGFGKGWVAFHTYDTSSYGLRENGPSKEGRLDLPAYQVGVTTYWQPWVADSWEQWHEFDWDCENVRDSAGVIIGQTGSECGQRAACGGAAIGDMECGEWKTHGSGKIMIDMRWVGFPQFYVTRTSARDVTQPPPNIPAVNDELRQCNIPVPVIEVQSILTNP